MGATPVQIVVKVIFPESWPYLLNSITLLFVSLTEYSAMAGMVGGSGLGNMAIQYGYYRFDMVTMFLAVFMLIVLVQLIQWTGDKLVRHILKIRGLASL
jgi:D-methionine transport system permease protein